MLGTFDGSLWKNFRRVPDPNEVIWALVSVQFGKDFNLENSLRVQMLVRRCR